jgi:hypothetical protein
MYSAGGREMGSRMACQTLDSQPDVRLVNYQAHVCLLDTGGSNGSRNTDKAKTILLKSFHHQKNPLHMSRQLTSGKHGFSGSSPSRSGGLQDLNTLKPANELSTPDLSQLLQEVAASPD